MIFCPIAVMSIALYFFFAAASAMKKEQSEMSVHVFFIVANLYAAVVLIAILFLSLVLKP